MRKFLLAAALLLLAVPAAAQTTDPVCTDATNTNCAVKKNQPFTIGADAPLAEDAIPTERWRLYKNGLAISEVPNTGAAPAFLFASGLGDVGDVTFYLEAIGTAFDANGQPAEVASGPSNVVLLHIVTGSLSAPKNLHIIKK